MAVCLNVRLVIYPAMVLVTIESSHSYSLLLGYSNNCHDANQQRGQI